VVVEALDQEARKIPVMPGEEGAFFAEQRRADALVALCSARLAADPHPDRATVVVRWFRPDGTLYRSGPGPPRESIRSTICSAAVG
jgi:hypothetical protein